MAALIRELEPLIHAAARSIPVVLDLPDRLPPVSGDDPQLRQLILNLVSNAAESMTGLPGAIVISAHVEDAGRSIVIEVRDHGIGMDAETRARIFDPYFSTKFTGRGLGLAVVHGVVRAHGGRVTVVSASGQGATFAIHLPAMVATVGQASAPISVIWPIRGTVLVVDDDDTVRRTLTRTLKRLGLVVLVAGSGDQALEIAHERSADIDVVLTDLTMPGMNGIALARALKAIWPQLPIVLISGYGEIPVDCASVFAGALAKPFDVATLHALLQPLLGVPPTNLTRM
jgi:CheY-like chemotaxis protein